MEFSKFNLKCHRPQQPQKQLDEFCFFWVKWFFDLWSILEQQCTEEHWMNHGIDSELGRSLTKINQVQEVIKGVRIIIPGSLFFSIYISNFGSPSLALLSQFFFFITSCWCKLEIVLLSFISFLVVLYLLWYKAG